MQKFLFKMDGCEVLLIYLFSTTLNYFRMKYVHENL